MNANRFPLIVVVLGILSAALGIAIAEAADWDIDLPTGKREYGRTEVVTGNGNGPGGKWCQVRLYEANVLLDDSSQKVALTIWEQDEQFDPPAAGWCPVGGLTALDYHLWKGEEGDDGFLDKVTIIVVDP